VEAAPGQPVEPRRYIGLDRRSVTHRPETAAAP
jgi:hypothetical protein